MRRKERLAVLWVASGFLLMATVVHFTRYFAGWTLVINGFSAPLGVSLGFGIVAFCLSASLASVALALDKN